MVTMLFTNKVFSLFLFLKQLSKKTQQCSVHCIKASNN